MVKPTENVNPGSKTLILMLAIGLIASSTLVTKQTAKRSVYSNQSESNLVSSELSCLTLKINLNRANTSELMLLPRIGPSLARLIIEDRHNSGPLASIDDLQRIKGIGPRTVDRVREFAIVDSDSFLAFSAIKPSMDDG